MRATFTLFTLIGVSMCLQKAEQNVETVEPVKTIKADKGPVPPPTPPPAEEPEKQEPEYRLVMLTANWCGPCRLMKDRLKMAAFSVGETTTHDVMTVDIQKHPDAINGRRDKRIPTFILQKKDGKDWIEIRNHVGTFPVGNFYKLWPEIPKKAPPKEQHASGEGSVRKLLCGCNSQKSAEHLVDAQGEPIGATGRYVKTHTITATGQGPGGKWCAKCGRYH